jgi:transposase-like protein
LFTAPSVNFQGKKEVLGFGIADTEGAKFWMHELNEPKKREVGEVPIACTDGLTGFPEAIRTVSPKTRIQLCIVHMVRNSTKFVSYKDHKVICADFKAIYPAPFGKAVRNALEEFGPKRNGICPIIYRA